VKAAGHEIVKGDNFENNDVYLSEDVRRSFFFDELGEKVYVLKRRIKTVFKNETERWYFTESLTKKFIDEFLKNNP
jgi:hypothetical protein